jgi:cytochrome c553
MIATNTEAKRRRRVRALVLTAGLCAALLGTGATLASDEPGMTKAEQTCAACHGPAGNRPVSPETPRLAGQQYDYLVLVLSDYRQGTRDNPIMSPMAKPLTDKEIRDLASYFSRQAGLTTKR